VRRGSPTRRVIPAALLAAAAAVLLCACAASSHTPRATPAAGTSTLIARLDRLAVRRSDAFPQNHLRFSFPAHAVVTDPQAVRQVARALLALPRLRPGVYAGPVDLGVAYHLTFFAGARPVWRVTVDATGMQNVVGAGAGRVADRGFWTTLAGAMGLADPGSVDFGGSFPAS